MLGFEAETIESKTWGQDFVLWFEPEAEDIHFMAVVNKSFEFT